MIYYSILTINSVLILLHDVIHHSQNTAHDIWQFSRGLWRGRASDLGGQEPVVPSDSWPEDGEQSRRGRPGREDSRVRHAAAIHLRELEEQARGGGGEAGHEESNIFSPVADLYVCDTLFTPFAFWEDPAGSLLCLWLAEKISRVSVCVLNGSVCSSMSSQP